MIYGKTKPGTREHRLYYSTKFKKMWDNVFEGDKEFLELPRYTSFNLYCVDYNENYQPTYFSKTLKNNAGARYGSHWQEYARRDAYIISWMILIGCLFPTKLKTEHRQAAKIITTYIKSLIETNINTLQIWPPNKIKYAYLQPNYAKPRSGILGNSCMRGTTHQPLLDFYVKNNVSIIVMLAKGNKILGRALLWPNLYFKGFKVTANFMDRIYTYSDKEIQAFQQFADKQGFVYGVGTTFYYKKKCIKRATIKMPVTLEGIKCLPYTDTMKYLFVDELILTNQSRLTINRKVSKNTPISLTTTNVVRPEINPDYVKEVLTGEWILKQNSTFIDKYKGYILNTNIVHINKESYSKADKDVCLLSTNKWALKNCCIYSEPVGGYVEKKKALLTHSLCHSKNSEDDPDRHNLDKILIKDAGLIPNTKKWRDKYVTVYVDGGEILVAYPPSEKYVKSLGGGKYRLRDKVLTEKKRNPAKVKDPQTYMWDVGTDTWNDYSFGGVFQETKMIDAYGGITYHVEKIKFKKIK